jgi:hypothetical protein
VGAPEGGEQFKAVLVVGGEMSSPNAERIVFKTTLWVLKQRFDPDLTPSSICPAFERQTDYILPFAGSAPQFDIAIELSKIEPGGFLCVDELQSPPRRVWYTHAALRF